MKKHDFSNSISDYVSNGHWREIENFFNSTEFVKQFGVNVVLDGPSQAKCEVNDVKAFHLVGVGQDYVNGAVISGVFDLIIGLTAIAHVPQGNIATTNINIRFLKPVEKGRFYATAKVNSMVGNRVFSESTLFNGKDEPCAYANGEIRIGIS